MKRKFLREIEVNNNLEAQKHLRFDDENQMIANLQMNGNRIIGLADTLEESDTVQT